MNNVFTQGLNIALEYLSQSLTNKHLNEWLTTAFGTDWELERGQQLIHRLGIDRELPPIQIVAASEINGAKGAYDNTNGQIYISEEFINQNLDRPATISAVLLEELGHYIDSVLNAIDSPGDEGAIFANLIQGQALSPDPLASLKTENDHTIATINGQSHQLELAATYGNVTVDGNLTDWTTLDRLDFLPNSSLEGYEVYGKYTQDNYLFALKSTETIGQNTTIWLNTDRNTSTGYQIFGFAGGAEYNINIDANGNANLYAGGDTLNPIATLESSLSADGKSIEIVVPKTQIGLSNPNSIDALIDINNSVYLPGNYGSQKYTVSTETLPQRTDTSKKIGIIYSETSADKFFDKKSYSRLFMNVQQQAMQAGIPFDLLTEQDLTDINKVAQYDTLVFPSFSYVNSSLVSKIEENLTNAVYKYGTDLVAAGNFMTNDETGAFIGSSRMQNLLGVTPDFKNLQQTDGLAANAVVDAVVKAKDINGGILQGYTADEQIYSYQQSANLVYPYLIVSMGRVAF